MVNYPSANPPTHPRDLLAIIIRESG